MGVDMIGNDSPSLTGGTVALELLGSQSWWIDSESSTRKGDTIYVECTSQCKAYQGRPDLLYRRDGTDASRESGTFYTRVSSPTYIGTYAEACFIRAEVLFNQGNKGAAFNAYKKGIAASIDGMNDKLKVWCREDANLEACPSFSPMTQTDIDNYLNNGIGTEENITLGKILTQKRLALHFSMEIWNDMRRYDFNPELFLGWGIPARYGVDATAKRIFRRVNSSVVGSNAVMSSTTIRPICKLSVPLFRELILQLHFGMLPRTYGLYPYGGTVPKTNFSLHFIL